MRAALETLTAGAPTVSRMTAYTALIAYLASIPAIAGIVGDRVVGRPAQSDPLPLVVVEPMPYAPRQTIQQGIPVNEPRFRIHCVAGSTEDGHPDYDAVTALADAVRDALIAVPGVVVGTVRFDRALIELEQLLEDEDTHHARHVLRISLATRGVE